MEHDLGRIARRCLEGAERGSMDFPAILGALAAAGFEGYQVDFRRGRVTYYHPAGEVDLPEGERGGAVADQFDVAAVRSAIAEAQALVPGYTYPGFCRKVRAAGCAGYQVSLPGRRAVYYGKSAECHVEHFPK